MTASPGSAEVVETLGAHEEDHPHKSTLDRLIYMANQIGWFFKSQPQDKIVPGILDHIQHFWDPRMRSEIFRHIDETGGTGIEPYPLEALIQLKKAAEGKRSTRGEAEMVETGEPRLGEAAPQATRGGEG